MFGDSIRYLPILSIDESPFHANRLVITREMGRGVVLGWKIFVR